MLWTLCADIGNTRGKWGVFKNHELVRLYFSQQEDHAFIREICSDFPLISHLMLSSVAKDNWMEVVKEFKSISCFSLPHIPHLPFPNLYGSPETLGPDRLANAIGAAFLYPKAPSLIIDAGTCIKYDLVAENGAFYGGSIAPGIKMRLDAMHHFTGKLPLIALEEARFSLPPSNTHDAVLSGALHGAILEAEGFIHQYSQNYPTLQILLTGGDAIFFENALKKRIFACPHLTLQGLNVALLNHLSNSTTRDT